MIFKICNYFSRLFYSDKIKELFGIDIRSLALFRIGLSLVLLRDLIIRFQDITAHYSDMGLLPRDMLIEKVSEAWHVSLHLANGTPEFQYVLFILSLILVVALLIGYQTRIVTILVWILVASIHSRNPLILQGGDSVLRLLLFWAMFLPLGACWSVDAWQKKTIKVPNQYISVATFALLLQVCFIYWFSALLKTDDSWRIDGTAVWYALSLEQFSTSFGKMLLQYPNLLKVITFATFYLEAVGPFLAFSPIYTGPLRFATALMFISFHLIGLNLTMELGPFVYVCAVAWIVFIPSWFWDRSIKVSCLPSISWKTSHFTNVMAAFFIGSVFLWNVQTLGIKVPYFTPPLQSVSILFRLDQHWNMFAPFPMKLDGWFIIPAKLRDGTEVDLFKNGLPITWKKPGLISSTYKNDRWKSYMLCLLMNENNAFLLESYAWYLGREWNKSHSIEKHLQSLDIIFMLKIVSMNEDKPHQKITLWHHEWDPDTHEEVVDKILSK
ncbi:MAG: HTTM domain-containing protein [Parachlamydiaceae bacterium]|nr:HTTM domain-containing protein [Parachlamydiaceae bacterium]